MGPAEYWEALDKLAGAYGARNRLDAKRAASLANGLIAVAFAGLALYARQWSLGAFYVVVSVGLFVVMGVARRRMRQREREIALLRVLILGLEGRRERLTH